MFFSVAEFRLGFVPMRGRCDMVALP